MSTPSAASPGVSSTESTKERVLIVDDDDGLRGLLVRELARKDIEAIPAKDGEEGLRLLDRDQYPVVVSDVRMPGMSGLELLKRVKEREGDLTEVIVLTGHGTIDQAIEAIRGGAYHYLTKPVKVAELAAFVRSASEKAHVRRENLLLRRETASGTEVVGASKAWQKVERLVEKIGPTSSTVLLLGRSGTGKEIVARAIHRLSTRAARPFVAINCASVTASLLESELFGHEAGAFTGAQKRRRGLFELAQGGTLFLDEIGETGTDFQAKLLRVLETGEFRRVGGDAALRADVRVVAATNRDLKAEIDKGRFRDDLYYRLNVLSIELPVLSERKEDIPLLVQHFLKLHGKSIEVSPEALELLTRYPWPGNVRELRNAVERMAILSEGSVLSSEDLPGEVRAGAEAQAAPAEGESGAAEADQPIALAELERRHILKVLEYTQGNKMRAARILGVTTATLYNKLKAYASQPSPPVRPAS
ncbi:sigma-54-dependent Fis family transcriptional regulator [bacterium]|nr:sigma-54-dependent Fis family transcriptional regulator [bacterium]